MLDTRCMNIYYYRQAAISDCFVVNCTYLRFHPCLFFLDIMLHCFTISPISLPHSTVHSRVDRQTQSNRGFVDHGRVPCPPVPLPHTRKPRQDGDPRHDRSQHWPSLSAVGTLCSLLSLFIVRARGLRDAVHPRSSGSCQCEPARPQERFSVSEEERERKRGWHFSAF